MPFRDVSFNTAAIRNSGKRTRTTVKKQREKEGGRREGRGKQGAGRMWFSFLQSSDAFAKKYDIKSKVLGQGKFAKVYEATEKETGKVYAAKVILK